MSFAQHPAQQEIALAAPDVAVLLLFLQTPTDRALAGWKPFDYLDDDWHSRMLTEAHR